MADAVKLSFRPPHHLVMVPLETTTLFEIVVAQEASPHLGL